MKPLVVAVLIAPLSAFAQTIDFESTALGGLPAGWSVAMTGEGGEPRWAVERDSSSAAGERVLAQLSDDRASGRFPLALYDGVETANGTIRVRFKPIAGGIDQAAGLVWRYRDADNYYVVRANARENNVVAYKVENGRRAPLGRGDDYGMKHTVPTQQWSTLEVVFRDSRFIVSFNGERLLEVEDSTFEGPGKVGVWTKADSVTYFDAFEVSAE